MDEKRKNILRMTVIESASPLTKQPSTQFRVAVLGLPMEDSCYVREDTVDETEPYTNPAPLPVMPKPPAPNCDLLDSEIFETIVIGSWSTFPMNHGKNLFDHWTCDEEDKSILEFAPKTKDLKIKVKDIGEYSYTFYANYTNGLVCEVVVTVKVTPPVLECGKSSSKLSGSGANIYLLPIVDAGTYYLYANLLSAPDDTFIWAGKPEANGSVLLAHWTQHRNKHVYKFDYDGSIEGVYLQVNKEGTKGTAYNFMMYCPDEVPQEAIDKAEESE